MINRNQYIVRVHVRRGFIGNAVFSTFRNSDDSFECLYCVLCKYKQEVEDLKIQVSFLTTELATRKKSTQPVTTSEPQSDSTLVNTNNNNSHSVFPSKSIQQPKPPQAAPENKFNLIFYGVSESPINTQRTDRQQHDFQEISSILSSRFITHISFH